MSSHKINELIDKVDTFETVRDEIAAILAVETANQQTLATAAGKDPDNWKFRVFRERSIPWSQYLDAPDQEEGAPIVNVAFDDENFDRKASNPVRDQKATAVYHLDCYGYGKSAADGAGGHTPGDLKAALEAHRAVRLVRNILMSGHYTRLGMRGVVWNRWIRSVTSFQPPMDAQSVQRVVAARIAFEVEFSEHSPQVQGTPLALIAAQVEWSDTGEVLFNAHFDHT